MRIFHIKKPDIFPIPNQQFDERDTMFARVNRMLDSTAYNQYYSNNPGLKKNDDHIRDLIPLLHPNGKYYDNKYSEQARRLFNSIETISINKSKVNRYVKLFKNKKSYSTILQRIVIELGGVTVGCTNLEKAFIYSHKGRFDDDYGKTIKLDHQNVLVFLVEMDFKRMSAAPKADTIYESANQYYRAAVIAKTVEAIIQQLGFDTKAHYDAHYDIILPPLAVQAGLGELGRNNILIADKFGSRVRIGAVTTNLPLSFDKPISIGAQKFCDICKKCAENCPTKALSFSDKTLVRGIKNWTTKEEKCYSIWRYYGTDCGICMAVCPYSHRNNLFHYMIRLIVKFLPIFNKLLLFFDDLVYGNKWTAKQ